MPFDPASEDTVILGDMTRKVVLLSARTGARVRELSSELLTAVPTQNAAHPDPAVRAIVSGTASGRLYLWT